MKIFVAIIALLIVVNAEDENDYEDYEENSANLHFAVFKNVEWTGNIKTLVDTAQLRQGNILNISRTIFGKITMNCNGAMEMPNPTFLPSPTDRCDMASMSDLTAAVSNPQSFSSEKFLEAFWSSVAGEGLLQEITERGVSEDVVKAAMKETWFSTTNYRDSAFNRLFLGRDGFGTEETKAYNSWYTFNVDKQKRSNCNFTVEGEELPVVVAGWCEGQTNTSHFIYPSHPFVDLTLYTLCAWDKEPEKYRNEECLVVVPGSENRFRIVQEIFIDDNGTTFLSDVNPVYKK